MTSQDLQQIAKVIDTQLDKRLTPIVDRLDNLDRGQARIETVIDALKAGLDGLRKGQEEIKETMATKADLLTMGVKMDKLRKRIEGIEEHEDIPNPHKN